MEHDPERIWDDTLACVRAALDEARLTAADVAALGITNQRETTLIWERAGGRPIHPAIVWQDRRTAPWCAQHGGAERDRWLQAKTGLLLDPYFSATKIGWLLDHVPGARARARTGELAFGTVDTWLLWKLTGGKLHATDATNASRTLLFDLHAPRWCRMCATARPTTARRCRNCSARRSPSVRFSATSKPPSSAKPAFRRA
ncbi:MAG: FGGY family carbohydrate kinase [Sinobacteraceae bacterium]|nr:FGGY family carbohydrate kinase [Nevskiaceae bacterium]